MTIGDKIRKMSDKELSILLSNIVDYDCNNCPAQSRCPIDHRYEDCVGIEDRILDWLKTECDEDYSGFLLFLPG